ncbi:uncharacterized protein J8A68_004602 [[Candida] subhashii]|uniref:Uncharacterized protein n=1 Tax=[Candida] subhashii TaxID=561895 RepID=A0A8J5QJA2_9ASCO|nr:uncharacterized protein J8A68_004602 [[Candida] subhashii]KAG7661882.1 hypothetical protein J8A68_004602 [[Candida] subhashii]
MATYGRKNHRKRNRISLEFSSDIEQEQDTPIIQDHQQKILDNKSSKKPKESNTNNQDSRSPKRYCRVVNSTHNAQINASLPVGSIRVKNTISSPPSTRSGPAAEANSQSNTTPTTTKGRNTWGLLFDGIEDEEPRRPAVWSSADTKSQENQKKSNRDYGISTSKRDPLKAKKSKTIKKTKIRDKKSVWNELFDSIEEPQPPPLIISSWDDVKIIPKAKLSNETSELETSALEIELEFKSLFENQTTNEAIPTNNSESFNPMKNQPDSSECNGRTYGQYRTLLLSDNEAQIKDENEDIKKEFSTKISDELDFNLDSVVNINDMRVSGKLAQDNDEVDYIIEGLGMKLSSHQTVVISTLLELAILIIDNSNKLVSFLDRICSRLQNILRESNSKETKLVCINICLLYERFGSNIKVLESFKSLRGEILTGLAIDIDLSEFSRVNRSMVQKLLSFHESYVLTYLEILKSYDLIDWNVCLSILDLVNTGMQESGLVEYIEEYFQHSKPIQIEINRFHKLFQSTFLRIENDDITEHDLTIIRALVLLSTNYDKQAFCEIYDPGWVSSMLKYINHSSCDNDLSKNLTLCLVGVLVNLVEWDLLELRDFTVISNCIQRINELQSKNDQEIFRHISGYLALVLTHLKIKYGDLIEIPSSLLLQQVMKFKQEIHTQKGLNDKVSGLLQLLGTTS